MDIKQALKVMADELIRRQEVSKAVSLLKRFEDEFGIKINYPLPKEAK